MTGYRAYFQRVSTLTDARCRQMADIYFQSYAGSDIVRFISDLRHKDEVLLLEYRGELVGFSSVQFYAYQQAMIIYSGDTIVMPEHWKQQTLHRVWIARMALLREQYPGRKLYWFLLVKGLRTYKYLKTFAKTFYPHWEHAQPELKALADALATAKFGALYNSARGVVECPADYGYLQESLAAIAPALLDRPEAAFFLRKNPHYARGHELVCICEIAPENLTARYQKLFVCPDVEFCNE